MAQTSECKKPSPTTPDASRAQTDACSSTTTTQPDVICSRCRCRCRDSNGKRSRSRCKHATSNSGTSGELTRPVSIQLVSFQRKNNEITFDRTLSITEQTESVTSCQLVKDSGHIVTSSIDTCCSCKFDKPCGTVKVWNLTAKGAEELASLTVHESPVHKIICIADRSEETRPFPYLILAGTESGHLIICRSTLDKDKKYTLEEKKKIMQLHAPNPLTALAISSDQRHLVTGSQYVAFDFVNRTHHNSSLCGGSKLDRRTRGTVKTWNWALLRASQSNADLVVTFSRTDRQLMSSMTSEREAGYGVTSLTLCEDSSLLAVGLSSIALPASSQSLSQSSSSSSAAAAAAVVICNREKMETLWITDNLKSSCVHDAVFLRQQHTWSLFITTDTTVEKLYLKEKMALQKTGLTICA